MANCTFATITACEVKHSEVTTGKEMYLRWRQQVQGLPGVPLGPVNETGTRSINVKSWLTLDNTCEGEYDYEC